MEVAVREGGGSWTDLVLGLRYGRNTNHVEAVAKLKKSKAAEPSPFRRQAGGLGGAFDHQGRAGAESNPWGLLEASAPCGTGGRRLPSGCLGSLTKALGLNPLDLEARYRAALILRDAGEKGHARGNLQQVVRLARDPILLAAAQIALKELEGKP
jgi:hypothetical protein